MKMQKKIMHFFIKLVVSSILIPMYSCSHSSHSNIVLNLPENTAAHRDIQLIALNKNALDGIISTPQKDPHLYFLFDKTIQLQKILPVEHYALEIEFEPLNYEHLQHKIGHFSLSFLYDDDLAASDNKKLHTPLNENRSKIIGDIKNTQFFTISMGFASTQAVKSYDSICGCMVYSEIPIKINSISIKKAQYGWIKEKNLIWCGFDAAGGQLPKELFSAHDIPLKTTLPLFPASSQRHNEQVDILFNHTAAAEPRQKIELSCGNNNASLSCEPSLKASSINSCFFSKQPPTVYLASHAHLVSGIVSRIDTIQPFMPINTDPAFILQWPQEVWRNPQYELFSWEQFPSVLIFDFADYAIQDLFFKRLAFYAEKKGFAGTLLTDELMQNMHGYNAHDYKAETLAAFFNQAEQERFTLNESELLLQDILFANGIIMRSGKTIRAGTGAVISISRESALHVRHLLLTHEGLHGIYFTQQIFREVVDTVFNAMDKKALLFLQRYFELTPSLCYNTDDNYLFKNEFMAYTLQQPIEQVQSYFTEKLSRRKTISAAEPELCSYIRTTNALAFKQAAAAMNNFLYDKWGIAGGHINQATIQVNKKP